VLCLFNSQTLIDLTSKENQFEYSVWTVSEVLSEILEHETMSTTNQDLKAK